MNIEWESPLGMEEAAIFTRTFVSFEHRRKSGCKLLVVRKRIGQDLGFHSCVKLSTLFHL
jgi:hypothetical protein